MQLQIVFPEKLREVVESPSMELLQMCLDKAQNKLICLWSWSCLKQKVQLLQRYLPTVLSSDFPEEFSVLIAQLSRDVMGKERVSRTGLASLIMLPQPWGNASRTKRLQCVATRDRIDPADERLVERENSAFNICTDSLPGVWQQGIIIPRYKQREE